MADQLEQQPWWPQALADMRRLPLRQIARTHGTTVAALEETLRRLGLIGSPAPAPVAVQQEVVDAVVVDVTPVETVPVEVAPVEAVVASAVVAAPAPARAGGFPGSAGVPAARARIAALESLLGVEPDGLVAKRAGVARKTVVEYRKLKGIPAYRGDAGAVRSTVPAPGSSNRGARGGGRPAAAAGAGVASRTAPSSGIFAPVGGGSRSSRLDAFAELIGVLPDREVAQRAGMSTENVRMYRARRGIAAGWRGEGAPASIHSAVPATVRPAAPAARAELSVAQSAPTSPRVAWQIFASLPDGERRSFGILGHDLVEAVQRAEAELHAQGWVIDGLRRIGEALEG